MGSAARFPQASKKKGGSSMLPPWCSGDGSLHRKRVSQLFDLCLQLLDSPLVVGKEKVLDPIKALVHVGMQCLKVLCRLLKAMQYHLGGREDIQVFLRRKHGLHRLDEFFMSLSVMCVS